MEPWEAYGTSDEKAPAVRICLNASDEWHMPEDEIHQGITSITVRIHGDDPSCAFIHVHGTEEDAVRAKWLNVQEVWNWTRVRDAVWRPR
jgi:hypothetical protein